MAKRMFRIKKNELCKSIVSRLLNKFDFFLVLEGDTGCLSGETKLYGQTETLEELYKSGKKYVNTYSLSLPKNYFIKSNSEIIPSGKKEVYEIELEDGRKVIATSEHKFFKHKGHTFEEKELKDLKVGDNLRTIPKGFIEDYRKKWREIIYERKTPFIKLSKTCLKCLNPFYFNRGKSNWMQTFCQQCKKSMKDSIRKPNACGGGNIWHEWEDNLLRNFYYSWEKEEILKLMPSRSWRSICKRAGILNLERDNKFKNVNNWSSENNPSYDAELRKKGSMKLLGKPSWNKGIHQWKGKSHPKGMLGKNHTEETKNRIIQKTSGELSHNWLGGISFEPYSKDFNKHFKKYIKDRDLNRCCLCYNSKCKIHVHHIDYDKLNSTEINCISLCGKCHPKTNFNREYWKEFLTKLVGEKYALLKN